jgi:outer membrane receptor protein involved in Fe transport
VKTSLLSLLCCLLFIPHKVQAQAPRYNVSGSVIDSTTTKGLEFVSVSLTQPDSIRVIASALTDSTGHYVLYNIAAGAYQLNLSFVGYQKKKIKITITSNTVLPKTYLSTDSKVLKEATVLSEKPVIKVEAGKITFDVAKTLTDGAETAMEALQKMPGITVNQDGGVNVKGKSGVRYLVDGKPSPMAQTNPEAFLKSIPSKNIESIEVITTPSAKYDASGSAAIINIHLKKGKLEGLNGSVSAGIGTVFDKYNASGNINYKKDKFNVFSNLYYRNEKMSSESIDERRVMVNNTLATYSTKNNGTNHSENASGKIGMEYSFDKHHSITYALDVDYWSYKGRGIGQMQVADPGTPTLSLRRSDNQPDNKDLSITNSLNFRKTYDSSDRAWSIDIAHTIQKQDGRSLNMSTAFDAADSAISALEFYKRTRNYGDNQNILFQTDYNTPLKAADSKLETGVKEEVNLHNTFADVYSRSNSTEYKDTIQSSLFKYIESITAAYITYSGKIKKFSYSGGLRWEHTYVHSDLSRVNQNYASIFPSATIGWQFNDDHGISASYSRRIDRPGFWMLNNAVSYNSAYSLERGNPEIRPVFVNTIELTYNAQIKEQNLALTCGYARNEGSFQSIYHTDSNRITYSRYENAGSQDDLSAGIDATLKPTKWWNLSLSTSYSYHWFFYSQEGILTHNQGGNLDFSGNMTFKFWKNASFSIWGWGSTGWVNAQDRNKPVGSVTATIKKKFFKDKFTVAISCRDVFHTMKWGSVTQTRTLYEYSLYTSQSTVGYLTLTYQFGNQTFTPETKGKSSRMGGGGGGGGGN